ncbi:HD-GYP domain-containing protein [Methylibium sp.]|uniref:HD-GYP domain-containing protein n=1 Tax=Methylibium sp. TaxID=2067992 RepID=UPI003D121F99
MNPPRTTADVAESIAPTHSEPEGASGEPPVPATPAAAGDLPDRSDGPPAQVDGTERTAARPLPLPSELAALQHQLATALGAPLAETGWPSLIEGLMRRCRALVQRDADSLLYLLVQGANRPQEHYSSQHALFCGVVVELCLQHLEFSDAERQAVVLAALTMNVSMTELQDELIHRERTPTLDQRRAIDGHPQASAELLRRAGIRDEAWLEIVALHHTDPAPELPYGALSATQRLASVLRRADVFTAKISSRRFRAGMPATLAARAACLGPNGQPDQVGSAVIKSLGMYPPGSYVRLASGEVAVVTRRGAKTNEPIVASLVGRDGRALPAATPRDTAQRAYAVTGVARAAEIRVPTAPLRMGTD